MLYTLKISVYNIKVASPVVPKAPLDYNFHILLAIVLLNYLAILFLVRGTEYPFLLSPATPLYRTLVTLDE
ncbi:hypothetical protein DL98DRAFT_40999 [Cadophora sp. DSE1049]|nr:hypothetical protein DL98DRAFT_40999 [Cadophora sp. DSE1049]